MEDRSKERIRFDEYVDRLLKERDKEQITSSIVYEGGEDRGMTSPISNVAKEETRLFMAYQEHSNLFNIAKHKKEDAKILKLRMFFKTKRHQQVEIYSYWQEQSLYTEGKVSTIGRDFVMITNLKERVWIPYIAIETANIPYGIPNYSNTHQNFMYDNDMRDKLLKRFGETVAKREVLKRQFFEESLQTNLATWEDTWLEIKMKDGTKQTGKLIESGEIIVMKGYGKSFTLDIRNICYIKTARWLTILKEIIGGMAISFKT